MPATRTPIAALLACLLLAPAAAQNPNRPPVVDRVDVTRWLMAFGRLDIVRPVGIQTIENPRGGLVVGVTPALPEPQAPPPGTDPADPRYSILDWMNAEPNRTSITLDQNPRDGRADGQPPFNNLIIAGARIPSGMTLVIAEGLADPDGQPVRPNWQMLVPRYGAGNYYATVSIPAAGIVRGQELYTKEHLEAYTANSLIYEAPDSAYVIVDNQLDGGTKPLMVEAIDIPPTGVKPEKSKPASRIISWCDPLQVEIVQQSITKRPGGIRRVRLAGILDNNFEAVTETWFRWAIETNNGATFVEIAANNILMFDLIKPPRPGDPLPPAAPGVPLLEYGGELINITLVATSYARTVGAAGAVPPFVKRVASLGNVVGLDSFISTGNTLSDTETVMADMSGDDEETVAHSICILLDASGSMRDDNKMDKAKASATRVLKRLDADTEVALIVYYDCGSIRVEAEFTVDKDKVLAILPRIQPSGGTPLAAGTAFAKDYMHKHASGATLDLIVLTDGEETCNGDPIAAARD